MDLKGKKQALTRSLSPRRRTSSRNNGNFAATAADRAPPRDRRQDDGIVIPSSYVVSIQEAFGSGADLYLDVLQVDRFASESELRVAYFMRGRNVLSQQQTGKASSASIADLSKSAKKRFQAVSMAYEILSNGEMKRQYDERGFGACEYSHQHTQPHVDRMEEIASVENGHSPTAPILRGRTTTDSAPRGRSRSATRSSRIRWKEEVEELLYKQHPSELVKNDSALSIVMGESPFRKPRKIKRKVLLEAQELSERLEEFNSQAESTNFVNGFLDDIEASLDGIEASVEGFVRYAMSESSSTKQSADMITSPSSVIQVMEGDQASADTYSVPSDAADSRFAELEEDATIATEEFSSQGEISNSTSVSKRKTSIRSLVGSLWKSPTKGTDNSSFKQHTAGDEEAEEDAAQSLFNDLTKQTSEVTREVLRSSYCDVQDVTIEDDDEQEKLTKQLFADLTKPPPASFIESDKNTTNPKVVTKKASRKASQPPLHEQRQPLSVPTPQDVKPDEKGSSSRFDPFGSESESANDGIQFDDAVPTFPVESGPPDWVVNSNAGVIPDCGSTVSTISVSLATMDARQRFLSRHSMARNAAKMKSKPSEKNPQENTAKPSFTDVDDTTGKAGKSIEFDRTRSGMSSLTGHDPSLLSHVTFDASTQHEQGLRGLCHSLTDGPYHDKTSGPSLETIEETQDDLVSSPCVRPCESHSDNDFANRLTAFFQAMGDDIVKFGNSFTQLMASMTVPEDDVQSVLDVLSYSMSSGLSTAVNHQAENN